MSLKTYKINYSLINSSELVREASREELLVLLSLIASGGRMTAEADVAQVTHLSLARVKSAIALWQAEEIISLGEFSPEDDKYAFAEIIDEFEQKKITSEIIDEEMSMELAKKIRNDELADVIEEITILMEQTSLNSTEIKNITALHTQFALSDEYIVTLAGYLKSKNKLTPKNLLKEAEKLIKKDISTVEDLEAFIKNAETTTGAVMEVKRFLQIYRKVSDAEAEMFNRWIYGYGYHTGIIGLAYDITTIKTSSPNKLNLKYMDEIISSWHDKGLKTLEECRMAHESEENIASYERKDDKGSARKKRVKESEVPKYSNFNAEDALMKALERSYKDIKTEGE